ncbi:hypothetical protein X728_02630 [Mesorhizobium sp. L103C120A0]|nr:hypothetical protein X728_02630 [Mesorhizobium sp. L103C120A0]
MAKTAEDNFRIEVCDWEERTLVETISRSPDSNVSQPLSEVGQECF